MGVEEKDTRTPNMKKIAPAPDGGGICTDCGVVLAMRGNGRPDLIKKGCWNGLAVRPRGRRKAWVAATTRHGSAACKKRGNEKKETLNCSSKIESR